MAQQHSEDREDDEEASLTSAQLRTRNLTKEERRRGADKTRPFKVVSEYWKSGGLGQVSQEEMIILTKEVDTEIAP